MRDLSHCQRYPLQGRRRMRGKNRGKVDARGREEEPFERYPCPRACKTRDVWLEYTGWPSSMSTTRDTNGSLGDRRSVIGDRRSRPSFACLLRLYYTGIPVARPGRATRILFSSDTITTPITVVLPRRRVASIPSRSLACNAFPFVDY